MPAGFRAAVGAASEGYTNTGWAQDIIHEGTGIELVFIPAGEFLMGTPQGDEYRDDDETQHQVRLSQPFYMGKYEVRQDQWRAVLGTNPSRNVPLLGKNDQRPVDNVTWDRCQMFVAKVGQGLRLPTEAEWEYACRAGGKTRFCFGDLDTQLGDFAWYMGNSEGKTQPVGEKRPNAWGLYDMHGNVWEWCQDWYGEGYYGQSPQGDPRGPAGGKERVMRGGSWDDNQRSCRSANRAGNDPTSATGLLGFRVAVTAQ